jgi:hypothetical protein
MKAIDKKVLAVGSNHEPLGFSYSLTVKSIFSCDRKISYLLYAPLSFVEKPCWFELSRICRVRQSRLYSQSAQNDLTDLLLLLFTQRGGGMGGGVCTSQWESGMGWKWEAKAEVVALFLFSAEVFAGM